MKYLLIRSPKGYINFEPIVNVENTEWRAWLLSHGYTIVGHAESGMTFRALEYGIAKGWVYGL